MLFIGVEEYMKNAGLSFSDEKDDDADQEHDLLTDDSDDDDDSDDMLFGLNLDDDSLL